VNLTVVAALMTIVGYSMNDTIIIFDRIRENLVKHKGLPLVRIINISLSQVLVRTLITSLTVFFVVVVLFFRAEGDIKDFAFAMIVGVVVGTYSSDFIASPVFWFLRAHGHRFGIKPKGVRVVTS
jgi:preprotein translocase SecF subunit